MLQLVCREVLGRYQGSIAGLLWSLLNPLVSLAMYTFVFGVVFKARWGLAVENVFDFAMVLFAGLTLHGLLSECILKAPGLIVGNANYVKQVVFPLEILPVASLGASLFHTCVNLLLLTLVWALSHGELTLAVILSPIIILPLCFIAVGISWLVAAMTVYFRDLNQVVGFISTGLLFFSPIFYPISSVPQPFRVILEINPLTYSIEHFRAAMIAGEFPSLHGYIVFLAGSMMVAWLGYAWFQKTRKGFADVL